MALTDVRVNGRSVALVSSDPKRVALRGKKGEAGAMGVDDNTYVELEATDEGDSQVVVYPPAYLGLKVETDPIETTSATTITIQFAANLDTGSVPSDEDFVVKQNGVELDVSAVAIATDTVTLTLATITTATTLRIDYTPGVNPLRAATGTKLVGPLFQAFCKNNV